MVRTEILVAETVRIILLLRYDLDLRRNPADCSLNLRGKSYHIFFHPDYTVGCGIPPHQRFRSQAVTAGQGFHLAPKTFI